jgi:hypothetical protein
VYLDTSWARVEIGNAATYGACTHREIQIPTAWAATSITATVNRGSFGASDAAYLYVIPSTGYGDVNTAGKAITFGGGASNPPTGTITLSVR